MAVNLNYVERLEKAIHEIILLKETIRSKDLAIVYAADKYCICAAKLDMVLSSARTRDEKWNDMAAVIRREEARLRNIQKIYYPAEVCKAM